MNPPDPLWLRAREQMLLDPAVINLNTGSFGPLPRVVFDHVTALRRRFAEEPMDFLVRQAPPLLWQARERLANFLGGDPRRLIFTANVTASVNTVAAGLRLAAPGEILLTDHEYGAMHWCWERAAQRQGLSVRTFPLPTMPRTADEIVDAFCGALTEQTRLLFFSHVLSPTGLVLPARAICAAARRRGVLTVVDGATHRRWCRWIWRPWVATSMAPIATSGCWLPPAPASFTSGKEMRIGSSPCR